MASNHYVAARIQSNLIRSNGQWGIKSEAFTSGSTATENSTIVDNEISQNGLGGIMVEGDASTPFVSGPRSAAARSHPNISRNLISDNMGYAILCSGAGDFADGSPFDFKYTGRASPRIEGNVIRNNTQSIRAITYPASSNFWGAFAKPTLINNTFWNNGPVDILAGDSTDITIINSIFWDGIPSSIQTEGNGKVFISNSNFDSLYAGEGNISADPLYVNAGNHNFSLLMQSPCIDTADNSAVIDTVDFLGNPRIADGNQDDSARVDMGAIETLDYCPDILDLQVTQPTCVGQGAIVISAFSHGILEYSADNGANWQPSNIFDNLGTGNYEIAVRVEGNTICTTFYEQNPVQITTPSPPNISTVDVTQPTCQASSSIVVNATGDGPLEYSADNGANWQTSSTFSNLTDGNHNIIVRLQGNITCTSSYDQNPVMIATPSPPNINSIDVTQPTCQTAGSIVVKANGDGILEYSADNGANWQSSNTFGNLADDNYDIIVRLQGNITCTAAYDHNPVMITTPGTPVISSVDVTEPTCQTTGIIIVHASGEGTLEYSADNGANWQVSNTFTNLADGNYNLVVRLQASTTCTSSYDQNPVMFATPTVPILNSLTIAQPTCDLLGLIVVMASGNGIVEYSIDGGQNWQLSNSFSNLSAGSYNVIIRLQSEPTCTRENPLNPIVLHEPTGCDPCQDNLMVDQVPIPSGTYQAEIQLSSMGTVAGGSSVLFAAGTNVELLPNFNVDVAGVFEIRIQPCPNQN